MCSGRRWQSNGAGNAQKMGTVPPGRLPMAFDPDLEQQWNGTYRGNGQRAPYIDYGKRNEDSGRAAAPQ